MHELFNIWIVGIRKMNNQSFMHILIRMTNNCSKINYYLMGLFIWTEEVAFNTFGQLSGTSKFQSNSFENGTKRYFELFRINLAH